MGQSIITPPVNIAASITYCCRSLKALCHGASNKTRSVCVWGVCVHICVSVMDCVRLIDNLWAYVCTSISELSVFVCVQLPERNLRGTHLDASVDKKRCSTSACDFVNLLSRKKKQIFGGRAAQILRCWLLYSKRDREPCNSNNKENPFCSVYQMKCPSHQNKFHMKMCVCLIHPELKKLSFVKAYRHHQRNSCGLRFQDGIHYWWMRELACKKKKSFALELLEYLWSVKQEQRWRVAYMMTINWEFSSIKLNVILKWN